MEQVEQNGSSALLPRLQHPYAFPSFLASYLQKEGRHPDRSEIGYALLRDSRRRRQNKPDEAVADAATPYQQVARLIQADVHQSGSTLAKEARRIQAILAFPAVHSHKERDAEKLMEEEEEEEERQRQRRKIPPVVAAALTELRRRLYRNRHSPQKVYDCFILNEAQDRAVRMSDTPLRETEDAAPAMAVVRNGRPVRCVSMESLQDVEHDGALRYKNRQAGQCSWRAFFRGLRLLQIVFASQDLKHATSFASVCGILSVDQVSFGPLLHLLRPHAAMLAMPGCSRAGTPALRSSALNIRLSQAESYASLYTVYDASLLLASGSLARRLSEGLDLPSCAGSANTPLRFRACSSSPPLPPLLPSSLSESGERRDFATPLARGGGPGRRLSSFVSLHPADSDDVLLASAPTFPLTAFSVVPSAVTTLEKRRLSRSSAAEQGEEMLHEEMAGDGVTAQEVQRVLDMLYDARHDLRAMCRAVVAAHPRHRTSLPGAPNSPILADITTVRGEDDSVLLSAKEAVLERSPQKEQSVEKTTATEKDQEGVELPATQCIWPLADHHIPTAAEGPPNTKKELYMRFSDLLPILLRVVGEAQEACLRNILARSGLGPLLQPPQPPLAEPLWDVEELFLRRLVLQRKGKKRAESGGASSRQQTSTSTQLQRLLWANGSNHPGSTAEEDEAEAEEALLDLESISAEEERALWGSVTIDALQRCIAAL